MTHLVLDKFSLCSLSLISHGGYSIMLFYQCFFVTFALA